MGNRSWCWPDTRHPSVVPLSSIKASFVCFYQNNKSKYINIDSVWTLIRQCAEEITLLMGGRLCLCLRRTCRTPGSSFHSASICSYCALIGFIDSTREMGGVVCAAPLATQFGVVYMTCSKLMDKSFAGVILSNKLCRYVFLQRPCLIGL